MPCGSKYHSDDYAIQAEEPDTRVYKSETGKLTGIAVELVVALVAGILSYFFLPFVKDAGDKRFIMAAIMAVLAYAFMVTVQALA